MQHNRRGPGEQHKTLKNLAQDRGQTKPGLDAFYDIRPGNGAGLFFNPESTMGQGIEAYTG